MIDIRVAGLVKSFDLDKRILDGLTFQVDSGERVGLLGCNGAGKTTLFRILTGELRPDEGEAVIAPGRRAGLISQIPVYPAGALVEDVLRSAFGRMETLKREAETLERRMAGGESDPILLKRYGAITARFEALGGYDTDTAVNKVAAGLSIGAQMRARPFAMLSGGEKTRVNLGRLILEDTDVLLLDEPTNHLDIHATEWLEEYLRRFHGTVLVISHDRYFLDRTVTRIVEIENGKAAFYSGNYTFYAEEKERRFQEQLRRYRKEQAKIEQLEQAAAQLRVWAYQGMDKTYRRAVSMEKRIERLRTVDKPARARQMKDRFRETAFQGDEVLWLHGVGKTYGERTLFSGLEFHVGAGERIALIGDNGTGKTTLLNIIAGRDTACEGLARLGPSVKTAYLEQTVVFSHPERSLLDTLLYEKKGMTAQTARNRLARYLFQGEDVFKSVSSLSGGELSRLRLCMLMDEEVNFLLLDEPTNHLDIASREWVESAVSEYEGALLFVSHDRYFIRRFATRIWELENGGVTDYPMGYDRYRAVRQAQRSAAPPEKAKKQSERPVRGDRAHQALRRRLTVCETAVARLEAECARLDEEMARCGADAEQAAALYAKQAAVREMLEQEMARWEELSTQWEKQEE